MLCTPGGIRKHPGPGIGLGTQSEAGGGARGGLGKGAEPLTEAGWLGEGERTVGSLSASA